MQLVFPQEASGERGHLRVNISNYNRALFRRRIEHLERRRTRQGGGGGAIRRQ